MVSHGRRARATRARALQPRQHVRPRPRRRAGLRRGDEVVSSAPRTRATRMRSTTSASCTSGVAASSATTSRRRSGIASAAEQGFARAQYNLGVMYDKGRGVPQDFAEAMKWFRKAADQNHAKAQFNIGFMYERGQGVAQNYAGAMSWYRKAADQGDAAAQTNVGSMYATGHGVPTDYAEAISGTARRPTRATPRRSPISASLYATGRGVQQDHGGGAQVVPQGGAAGRRRRAEPRRQHVRDRPGRGEGLRRSDELVRKAAQQGDASAQNNLGSMYAAGKAVRARSRPGAQVVHARRGAIPGRRGIVPRQGDQERRRRRREDVAGADRGGAAPRPRVEARSNGAA